MKWLVIPVLAVLFVCAPLSASAVSNAPAWWQRDHAGGFFGVTTAGEAFTHTPVTTITTTRLARFVVADTSWYVSDRGIIWASDDLHALSIYLSRAV